MRKRIAVLMPEFLDMMEHELMNGIHETARQFGYDVILVSDCYNAVSEHYTTPYIKGMESIYHLVTMIDIDGLIFCPGRFQKKELSEKVYNLLRKKNVPSISLDVELPDMHCVFADHQEGMYLLTNHLIEEHRKEKIYCVSGMPGHDISDERIKGYKRAMQEHNLKCDDSMIFYGYFWKDMPGKIADGIADGTIARPDAVACASDVMALALCEGLKKNGINVPDDIAVTGYDGGWRAALHLPMLTTSAGRERKLGIMAVCQMHEIITGEKCEYTVPNQRIQYGQSCGCHPERFANDMLSREEISPFIMNRMEMYQKRRTFMASNLLSRFSAAGTLEELAGEIDELAYTLFDIEGLDICLFDTWTFDFDDPKKYHSNDFAERSLLLLSKRKNTHDSSLREFPTKDFLPAFCEPHDPKLVVVSALHHDDQVFGYICASYFCTADIILDEHYIYWCDAIADGLDSLQKRLCNDYIHRQFEALTVIDPETGLFNKRGFLEKAARTVSYGHYYRYVMFTCRQEQKKISEPFSTAVMLASALRKASSGDDIYFRISERNFAVFFADNGDFSEVSWLKRFSDAFTEMQGGISPVMMPELVLESNCILLQTFSEIESNLTATCEKLNLKINIHEYYSESTQEQMEKLRLAIKSEPQKNWSISLIAEQYHLSPAYIQRFYKSQFGTTIMGDVVESRMERAKWLLLHTELRVIEVAEQSGYSSCANFMRQFHKKTGMTAMDFRKKA